MLFRGEQYVALTLTTRTRYDERIPIEAGDLLDGDLPEDSSILPWAVASLDPEDTDRELWSWTELAGSMADARPS